MGTKRDISFFAWFIYCFWWTAFLMSWTLSSPKKVDWSVLRVTKFFLCVCELGFFYFSYFNIAHNTISSFTKFLHVFNFSWYNTLLLIFVVFDRFINQVLLLCCFADKCHSVCENGWDLLKIVLLQEIHTAFFDIFLICRASLQPHVNSQNVQMCSVTVWQGQFWGLHRKLF